MPWGAVAGVVGSVAGSAISGAMSGGGGSSGGSYSPYIGAYQPQQDTAYYNNYNTYGNTLGNYYGLTSPLATNTLTNSYNNPYTDNYISGSQIAQNAYYGAGQQANNAGGADYALAQQLGQASQNWDANGAVKANLEQQAGDTANAQSYLRGIQGSPYGASVATNAVNQADLNYANIQLQNQLQAGQAATNAYGAGTQQYGAGAGYYGTGASLPYTALNSVTNNQSSALGNYYNTVSPYLQGLNQLQGNALQYLGYGNSSQNTAAQQAQQAASSWGNLGYQAGNGLYNMYNNSGSSTPNYGFTTGSSMYSSPSNYDYYGAGDYSSMGMGY